MTETMNWTCPAELRRQVRSLWERGRILSSLVTGEAIFPVRLALRRPSAAELGKHFDEARSWSASLRSDAPRSHRDARVSPPGLRRQRPAARGLDRYGRGCGDTDRQTARRRGISACRGSDRLAATVPASLGGQAAAQGRCSSPTTGACCSMSSDGSRAIRGPPSTCARWTFPACTASSWRPGAQ